MAYSDPTLHPCLIYRFHGRLSREHFHKIEQICHSYSHSYDYTHGITRLRVNGVKDVKYRTYLQLLLSEFTSCQSL